MPLSDGYDKCSLEPINLYNGYEYGELRRQRVLCGWDYEVEKLEKWKRDMRRTPYPLDNGQ